MQVYLSTRNGASKTNTWDRQIPINTGNYSNTMQRLFRIISIPSKTFYFRLPNHMILMEWTSDVNVQNENSTR
jgi:hypothetical protein